MNTIKQFYLPMRQTIITIIVCVAVVAGVSLVYSWTGPTQAPPEGNVPAPINVGSVSQYKSGALGVGGIFQAYSTALFDGNVGIGTAAPNVKLDVNGQIKGDIAQYNCYWSANDTPCASGYYAAGSRSYNPAANNCVVQNYCCKLR